MIIILIMYLLVSLPSVSVTAASVISLQKYQQYYSLTSCQNGLLDNVDKMVFRADINVSLLLDSLKYVSFETNRPGNPYKSICFMKITALCENPRSTCTCRPTGVKDVYALFMNVTAFCVNNGGQVRAAVTYMNNTVIYSEPQSMPTVYDPEYISTRLTLNNEVMNESHCNLNVNSSRLDILYQCLGQFPSPCQLTVIDQSTNRSLAQGSDLLKYTLRSRGSHNMSLLFQSQFCQSQKVSSVECSVKLELEDVNTKLYINNQVIDEQSCVIAVNTSTVDIEYQCVSGFPPPCDLSVFDKAANFSLATGSGILKYSLMLKEPRNVSLTFLSQFCQGCQVYSTSCLVNIELEDVNTKLYINNQVIDEQSCVIAVNTSTVDIEYQCVSGFPPPCDLSVFDKAANFSLATGSGILKYSLMLKEPRNVSLTFLSQFCQGCQVYSTSCLVNIDFIQPKQTPKISFGNAAIISICLLVLVLIVTVGICFVACRRRKTVRQRVYQEKRTTNGLGKEEIKLNDGSANYLNT